MYEIRWNLELSTFSHQSIWDTGLITTIAQLMSDIPLQFPVRGQKEEDFIRLGEENDSSIVMGGPYKVYCCHSKINCVQGKRGKEQEDLIL